MGDEFRCTLAQRFDGAGQSLPTAARFDDGVRCERAAALLLVGIAM